MTNNIPATETQAAFSRRIGVSRQHVGKLAKSGLPLNEHGDVRVREALQWIRRNVRPQNGALSPEPGDAPGLVEARTRLLLAQAAKAELDLKERDGSLIDREGARRATVAFARLYRDALLNFASRQGPALAAEWGVDARVVVAGLDAELRKLLMEISREPMPLCDDQ